MGSRCLNAIVGAVMCCPLICSAYSYYETDPSAIAYHSGTAPEAVFMSEELRVLNLTANRCSDPAALAQEIIASHADVVCLQDLQEAEASDFYQLLQEHYAHFIYVDQGHLPNGLLVASRLPLKDGQWSFASTEKGDAGLFSFELPQSASSSQTITSTPVQGYAGILTSVKNRVDSFYADRRPDVRAISLERYMSTTVVNVRKHSTEQYIQIGHAEVSGSASTSGEASLEASVSESKETNSGTFSAEVRGSVSQDSQGNTSGRIETTFSLDW